MGEPGGRLHAHRHVRHRGRRPGIAAGDRVAMFFPSANRDEREFPRPVHASTSVARRTTTCRSAGAACTTASVPISRGGRSAPCSPRCWRRYDRIELIGDVDVDGGGTRPGGRRLGRLLPVALVVRSGRPCRPERGVVETSEFGARSGGTTGSRSRTGRRGRRRPRARPTWSSSSSTTSASRSSAASAPTSRRPTIDRLAANGLRYTNFHTTALCSPTRACVLTGRNHHSVRHGPDRRAGHRLPGLRRPTGAVDRVPPADAHAARLRRVRGRQVAPHARRRGAPRRHARALAARPRLRALLRVLQGGETHQNAPALVHDNHFVAAAAVGRGRLPPHRGPRRPRVRVRHRPAPRRPGQAVLPLLRHRRVPLAAPGAAGVDRALPRAVRRRLGRLARADHRPPDCERRSCREGTELSPRPEWVPAWDSLPDDARRVYARFMEAFAGLPVAHRPPARPARRLPRGASASSTTRCCSSCPTTARRRRAGRSARSTTSARGTRGRSRPRRRSPRIDEIGGPPIHNNYPWGWTVAGNTPFRRWKREVHEGGVADPLSCTGRAACADRGRACGASTCTPSTSSPTILETHRRRPRPT